MRRFAAEQSQRGRVAAGRVTATMHLQLGHAAAMLVPPQVCWHILRRVHDPLACEGSLLGVIDHKLVGDLGAEGGDVGVLSRGVLGKVVHRGLRLRAQRAGAKRGGLRLCQESDEGDLISPKTVNWEPACVGVGRMFGYLGMRSPQ